MKGAKAAIGAELVGLTVCAAFNQTLAAVILLAAFFAALAIMWLQMMREIDREEIEERAEQLAEKRYEEALANTTFRISQQRYIALGKGYDDAKMH